MGGGLERRRWVQSRVGCVIDRLVAVLVRVAAGPLRGGGTDPGSSGPKRSFGRRSLYRIVVFLIWYGSEALGRSKTAHMQNRLLY